jgi:uncharacterized Zn finger protein (UPF0148 family)
VAAVTLNHPKWKRVCTARRSNGEPCRRWSIRGGFVCPTHGGRAPQVKKAAEERIEEMREKVLGLVPEAVDTLQALLGSSQESVRFKAAERILDQAGLVVVRKQELDLKGDKDDGVADLDAEIDRLLGAAGHGWLASEREGGAPMGV